MNKEYDIAIIGGGLAGASLACCLANQSLRIAVIEQVPPDADMQPSYDDRGLALSLSSQRILQALDIWADLAAMAVPVRHIHITDKGRFGQVHLHASDLQLPALGYVVVARDMGRALLRKMATLAGVDFICPATVTGVQRSADKVQLEYSQQQQSHSLSCKLLVAADGTHSPIRHQLGIGASIKDYGQTAIVSSITIAGEHHNTAYERFTRQGPLALLPMPAGRWVSIYTVASHRSDFYLALDEQRYLNVLQQDFGKRLGRMTKAGARKSYPLQLVRANKHSIERVVLLGNAAQTIHPNGAQGFNLGLRDSAALAEHIVEGYNNNQDPGDSILLERYHRSRYDDQSEVIRFTDSVAGLFYTDNAVTAAARNLGMLLLDMSPALKRLFIRKATGLYGRQPALVRER